MSPSHISKASQLITLKNNECPSEIEGYKVSYIMKKTLKTYCSVCASKHYKKILTVKLLWHEDDLVQKCHNCKKVF